MSTQSEKTGSEKLTKMDYERAKEMVKQAIDEESSRNTYTELYLLAVNSLTGWFAREGSVPVSLLEYGRRYAYKKAQERL